MSSKARGGRAGSDEADGYSIASIGCSGFSSSNAGCDSFDCAACSGWTEFTLAAIGYNLSRLHHSRS